MGLKRMQVGGGKSLGKGWKIAGLIIIPLLSSALIGLGIYLTLFYFQPDVKYEAIEPGDVINLLPKEYERAIKKAFAEEGLFVRIWNEGHKEAKDVRLIFDSSFAIELYGEDYLKQQHGDFFLNVYDVSVDSLVAYRKNENHENHRIEIDFESLPLNEKVSVKYKARIPCEPKVIYERSAAEKVDFADEYKKKEYPRVLLIIIIIVQLITMILWSRILFRTSKPKEKT